MMECFGEIKTFEKGTKSLKTGKPWLFEMADLIRSLSTFLKEEQRIHPE